jgi:ankyrin repeat protein
MHLAPRPALHPALNHAIGVMLGLALAMGDMAGAWQEQRLPMLAGTAPSKVAPSVGGHPADAHPARKSDPATRDRDLIVAAQTGNTMAIQALLADGANLRATNADGDTALIPAAHRGYVEVVSELVKAGVPPDATNNLGLTALIEAVALGDGGDKYEKTVQLLLDGGADPNLPDRGGVTPMRHARQRGFHGIGALLFKARGH